MTNIKKCPELKADRKKFKPESKAQTVLKALPRNKTTAELMRQQAI
jgi:hypothetical protein